MDEGTVERWAVDDGSHVEAGQPVVEVMTDKVTLELEAPASGIVAIKVPAGETVPVGTVLADIK
jgi:pyruvate/2-oxoglutarate dehydrogenase complex dihydrolipoamide acyltransferase (E2) component